jgi:predicted Zn finger-like uncharacterized protein
MAGIGSMDVQCERCNTEYEFDDALVSGRGTTVRCTQCGHQFKVRRPDTTDTTGDRWVVQTAAGPQLTFLTLRELQRAILAKQVARHDMLLLVGVGVGVGASAGAGAGSRPLASIAELEPFFDGRASNRPPPSSHDGAHARPSTAPLATPAPPAPLASPPPPPLQSTHPFGAPPATFESRAPRVPAPAATRPPPPPRALGPTSNVPPAREVDGASTSQSPVVARRTAPPRAEDLRPNVEPAQTDFRSSYPAPSIDEPFDIPGRRRLGGWVVALVLLLAVGVVGWVVAKPYLVTRSGEAATTLDPRARAFLATGESALAEGNLELSQQSFDKASVLAEGDRRVLLDEARVAAAATDVLWLKVRLLPGESAEAVRAASALLDERLALTRKAADQALAAAPDDPEAARAKIDALRLVGERDAARGYVPKVGPIASQPETIYVLAALDLAEPAPLWMTVIDRLRRVASVEANAGRAGAALVYALTRSGDAVSARTELSKLDAQARPYPLLPELHALVDAAAANADRVATVRGARADAGALSAETAAVPVQVPIGAARPAMAMTGAFPPPPSAAWQDSVPADSSLAMQAASQAMKRGDLGRARRIYEALVGRNPADSEALAGIGDITRLQGDPTGAIRAYRRALAVNPSYLPALLGVADTEWANGDRANAQGAYKDIADRFPEGTYPAYVASRAESPEPAPTAPAPAATAAKPWDPGDGI